MISKHIEDWLNFFFLLIKQKISSRNGVSEKKNKSGNILGSSIFKTEQLIEIFVSTHSDVVTKQFQLFLFQWFTIIREIKRRNSIAFRFFCSSWVHCYFELRTYPKMGCAAAALRNEKKSNRWLCIRCQVVIESQCQG